MTKATEQATSGRLVKNLHPHWVWAISLGSAVGWGAFILPADWIGTAGPLGALLGMAIGGGLMIVVGVSYGFLARVFPVSGGAFAYTLVCRRRLNNEHLATGRVLFNVATLVGFTRLPVR